MKAPQFWQRSNLISYLLFPLTYLYKLATIIRILSIKPKKITTPIICIGNLVAGGAGKTPIAIELGLMLKEMNIDFAYLSRGYSGRIKDFTRVSSESHNATQVGDEPILLAEIADTFISKNRVLAANKIADMPNKKIIILDDGFQDPSLVKDLSILVIDGIYGFGNGLLLPAGPLREDINSGIKRADLIIIIDEDKFNIERFCAGKKVIHAIIKPVNYKLSDVPIMGLLPIRFCKKTQGIPDRSRGQALFFGDAAYPYVREEPKNKITQGFEAKGRIGSSPIIAFCGIGTPDKFFNSLKKINANLIKTISYPDHYFYQDSDLESLISLSVEKNAMLVTTKKDWVRLSKKYQERIEYLNIRIEFDDFDYLKTQLVKLNAK